jgi:Flp pilus assembly protein TadG
LIGLLKRFLKERQALAALEFALIAPILAMLWVGIIEASQLHLVGRKATVAAQSAADLVAQRLTVNAGILDDIGNAMVAIFQPFPAQPMTYEIASVVADAQGAVSVDWRVTRGAVQGGGAVPSPALPLVSTSDSVIVVTVNYPYTPVLDLLFGRVLIEEQAFARPRRTRVIPLT